VPKPPAPKKPVASALAAAAAVIPTAPILTPVQIAMQEASKVDLKDAGKHFDGSCLPLDIYKKIKTASCKMNFSHLLDNFD